MNDHDLPELTQGTYLKESALALWEGLPRILLAGILFSLVSLPAILLILLGFVIPGILLGVFSVGPGYVALCAGVARSILREPTSFWGFPKAFAHFYWRGVVLGLLISLPLISASLLLPTLQNPPVATLIWVGLGADLTMLFFLTALYLYVYPQIVIYDLQVNTALKNSLRLAAGYLSNTLGLIGMAVLLALLASRVNYLLLVVFLGCWQVFVINNCRMVIRLELG